MKTSHLILAALTLGEPVWAEQVCISANPVFCRGWMSQAQIDAALTQPTPKANPTPSRGEIHYSNWGGYDGKFPQRLELHGFDCSTEFGSTVICTYRGPRPSTGSK
jgi:hypothetical protein